MGRATVSMAWTLRPAEFRVTVTLTKLCFSSQAVSWKVIKPKTRKGGSLPKGTWNTLWWCETRALWLFAYCKNRPRCVRRRVVNATLQFTNYEICTSPSRENAKARGKIPHAASFPWPNWNYLHIYLFPINVWLSACVQLEIWGHVCLLLKGPFPMGSPSLTSDLLWSDAEPLNSFTTLTCSLLSSHWPLKAGCPAPASVLQLSKISSIAPDLAPDLVSPSS